VIVLVSGVTKKLDRIYIEEFFCYLKLNSKSTHIIVCWARHHDKHMTPASELAGFVPYVCCTLVSAVPWFPALPFNLCHSFVAWPVNSALAFPSYFTFENLLSCKY
jgi:hypothetical protein